MHTRHRFLIPLLLLITAAAVCTTVWALFFRRSDTVLVPDYAPVATEAHAQPIPDDQPRQNAAEPGTGSVSLTYSNQVSISLSGKSASLLFANPGNSNQDMVLQLLIQDTLIFQSGRLTPGNQVSTLDLATGAEKLLTPGGYEGCFMVFYYDSVTAEKAIVNTQIPVTVTVSP